MPLGDNSPSCRGKLISNEYSLSIKGKIAGCMCCGNGSPETAASINFYNRPADKKVFQEPENWRPTVMNSFVCNFGTDYPDESSMNTAVNSELDYGMVNPQMMAKY